MKTHARIGTVLLGVLISALVCVPTSAMSQEPKTVYQQKFSTDQGKDKGFLASVFSSSVVTKQTFGVPAGAEAFLIDVVNGDAYGKNRVSSATVSLNGKELFRQKDFNQNVGALPTINLPKNGLLPSGNEFSVRMNGRAQAYLTVYVKGIYPTTPPPRLFYRDMDQDTFGAIGSGILVPSGQPAPPYPTSLKGGDCNDYNPQVYPGRGCAPLP